MLPPEQETRTSKHLREERAKLIPRFNELRDKASKRDAEWKPEDQTAWEAINRDYDDLSKRIDIVSRVEHANTDPTDRRDSGRNLPGRDDFDGRSTKKSRDGRTAEQRREDGALCLAAWARSASGRDITKRQREACQRDRFNPHARRLDLKLPDTRGFSSAREAWRRGRELESRTLSAVQGSTGAFMIPEGFVNSLEINMLAYNGVLQVCDVLRTDSGNDMPWPTADDTSNEGELLGENASIGSSVDPSFGQIVFKAHKFSSKLVRCPVELLEDSAFDLASELGRMLGERIGRAMATHMTTGTGGGLAPRGIVTAAGLGVTAASGTAIAADELLDLEHSINPAYRQQNGKTGYMLHDTVLLHIRKLKDGEGRWLFQSDGREGGPGKINGWPYWINQKMASSVATTAKTVLFGDFSKYKCREVKSIRLRRLVERYADNDQEGFIAFMRADGNLLDAGTDPVKYLQQA